MKDPMNTQRATDQAMPTAQDTVQANPMRPPADSPRTAKDAWRVFLSHPSPLILLAVLGAAGPWRALVLTASLAFLLQGLHYEWVHYLAHISWRPRMAYYERRVLEPRWHHFRNERLWWGVSRGLGDRVLGTAPDARDVARSDHTADLGIKR